MTTLKRENDAIDESAEDDAWIGPMPTEATKPKKRKVLEYERIFLNNLPDSPLYETSYMHRDIISHVVVTKSNFIITASCDGHIKFWRKQRHSIEFVKHFRSHLGVIQHIAVSDNGEFLCSIADDKSLKIFDVINFDMINMMKLDYVPRCCGWLFRAGDAITAIAVSDSESGVIHVYDGRGTSEPIHSLRSMHAKPVVLIKYNAPYEVVVSVDSDGLLEYWTGPKYEYKFPKNVLWEYKTDTDLYEFMKHKTVPTGLCFAPKGQLMATLAKDRKVRIFKFLTGKLSKVIDESLQHFSKLQKEKQQLPDMEFGRRLAADRDLSHTDAFSLCNIIFDESGNFVLYTTMLGIKVVNLCTNQCVRLLGRPENARFLQLALLQGGDDMKTAALTAEMTASDNPSLQAVSADPAIFVTALRKHRFYIFTRRQPDDTRGGDNERDVFNEKPSKEELVAATQDTTYTRISESAVVHTSMGDIFVKLFPEECPKTVENFCVHSRNGYFNGHLFHRIIKGFMIQTGDPLGNGTGGESIWGGEFEDEMHANLKHDRPYVMSMANAGPNTNGSQFFFTVAPTPWLDGKHTVFGRVTQGMDIVQKIGNIKVDAKTDKPFDNVIIVNISIK